MRSSILLLFTLFASSVLAQTYPGTTHVDVYARAIFCDNISSDDILDFDGKGNEVFLTCFYSIADASGRTKGTFKTTSPVYGDVNGFPSRVNRGSLSPKGGITDRDMILCNPGAYPYIPYTDPRSKGLIISNADLNGDDIITVIPVLWEWDNGANTVQQNLENLIMNSMNNINVQAAAQAKQYNPKSFPFVFVSIGAGLDLNAVRQILQPVYGWPGTRPLGMDKNGNYTPQAFVLNQNTLRNLSAAYYFKNGQPELGFDELVTNGRDHGSFRLLLNIEFSLPNLPKPPRPDLNIKNLNALTNPYTGKWTGTLDHGSGSGTSYFSMQLNQDGSLKVLDQNNFTLANGNYKLTQNNITGTFTYTSGDAFSFTLNMSPANATGTWSRLGTQSTSIANSGNLVLTKAAQ